MQIREYTTADREQLKWLIAQLQDFEAEFVPGMLPGKEMAENYLEKAILKDSLEKEGKIFVAEDEGKLVGFVWVYIEKEPRDLMYKEPIYTFLYIGDFIVDENFRGKGIGRALLEKAQGYAREKGITQIKLHTSAKNSLAREVYRSMGFEEDEVILVKKVDF